MSHEWGAAGASYSLRRVELGEHKRDEEPRDGDQPGELVRLGKRLGNHRVDNHREDRSGGDGGSAGDDSFREMLENRVSNQRRDPGDHRDAGPNAENITARSAG